MRFKEKVQNSDVFELDPEEDYALIDYLSDFQSQTPFFGGRYELGPFADPDAIRNLVRDGDFEEERDLEEDLADFTANEDTLAAYGMVELELGANMTLLGGLRAENTQTDYDAFELEVDEEGDPVALRPVEGEQRLHRAPADGALQVAARRQAPTSAPPLTRTLARPNFIDLAPYQLILREDEEIERGNPDLDVTTAWNLDLLDRALLRAGRHPLRRHLLQEARGQHLHLPHRGGLRRRRVRRDAEAQRRLGRDPRRRGRAASAASTAASASSSTSPTSIPTRAIRIASRSACRARPPRSATSRSPSRRGRFSSRASLNYHDEYVFEIGEEPEEDLFLDEQLQLDFSATFRFTDRWSVSLNLNNLTDEPYRVYEGSPNRPIQEEIYGWWGTIGLKFDM